MVIKKYGRSGKEKINLKDKFLSDIINIGGKKLNIVNKELTLTNHNNSAYGAKRLVNYIVNDGVRVKSSQ